MKIEEWRKGSAPGVLEEIERLERRIFPKHESLAHDLREEVSRRKCTLLFAVIEFEPPGSSDARAVVVVGYLMISWTSSLAASISKLAVKEAFRGKGYGRSLLQAAVEKCKSRRVQSLMLHVDPCRTPALRLYESCGFTTESSIEAYYSPGRDAYRMVLDLNQGW